MNLTNLSKGLSILNKFDETAEVWIIDGEVNVEVWTEKMDMSDKNELKKLGWHIYRDGYKYSEKD